MRPEFILNFLAITPSTVEIKKTYKSVFPTLLGIRLARGVDSEELTAVLKKVREALELEPGRREAIIAELSDQLKSDFHRPYSQNFVAV